MALVGRPNVGKSALVNAILGQQRVIVSDIAGTTRDAIDTPFEYAGEKLTLIDTAGIRRPGRVDGSIEHYSVMRSKAAIERADVAVCVFDASVRLRAQDLHVIGQALDASTGLVVGGNKWDLMVEDYDRDAYMLSIRRRLRFVPWAPVVLTSALHGIGLDDLLKEVLAAGEERRKRIPTGELNAILRGAMSRRPPPLTGKQRMKMLYATQVKTQPPTFVLFVNDGALITAAYQRYLENALRKAYGFRRPACASSSAAAAPCARSSPVALELAIAVVCGYLLGSIPFGLIVSKRASGSDLREFGSGKTGFTNSLRVLGLKRSMPVFAGDLLKGAAAALAAIAVLGRAVGAGARRAGGGRRARVAGVRGLPRRTRRAHRRRRVAGVEPRRQS